jgi:ribosomal protein S18 acetylase RimI-like enzyme
MDSPTSLDSSALRVRPATAADRPALLSLINTAFSIETFLDGTRTDDAHLADMMEKGSILVAENGSGGLVASIYTEVRGRRGYLGMLAVDPALQGSGLARRLVTAAEDCLRRQGCAAVDITVLSQRTELLPLYRRFGFVETGREEFSTPRTLTPGVECYCIVMSKEL